MSHCDEIVAISLVEHMRSPNGYALLLSAVKSSLKFAFLNGETSYASYCTIPLHHHYSAGIFHQNMKQALFTTPHKNSDVNIALDTQRQMNHKDDLKAFRSGSS
ncbi:unnamed protein product [Owenia fusiformis]|uniref:Uncharacterized protein n=1 Tax=Owenia fusiformis TaxID=6347 RepID=A0A8J1TGA2_OWEFU|nr:unnamed protein product [Owenia fusiformis]